LGRFKRLISWFFVLTLLSEGTVFAVDTPAVSPGNLEIERFSNFRKEKGLRNLEPQSLILLSKGVDALKGGKREDAIAYFNAAASLSPDLPQPYIYLAKIYLSFSSDGLTQAIGYIRDAVRAYLNNFWWLFKTAGNLIIALYMSLYLSVIIVITLMVIPRFQLYLHDIQEDRKRLLLLLPSLIITILSPLLGILAFILPFWLYLGKKEKRFLYGVFAAVAILAWFATSVSVFLNVSTNTTLKNIININSGFYTGGSYLVKDTDDFESAFTYALDLKRKGRYKEAIQIYTSLIGRYGHTVDAKLYNNIANCYVGLNDNQTAIKYYNDAIRSHEIASAYYNLSQMFREFFDFKKGEEYYNKALSISPQDVKLFTGLRGTTVNSFVVDEILSMEKLWSRAFRTTKITSSGNLEKVLYRTNRWVFYVMLLLIIIALNIYERMAKVFAYRCVKCGDIYCTHCEKKIVHKNMCHMCHRALNDISSLNVRERTARLVEIQHYRDRVMRRVKIMSILLPGSGHIFAGLVVRGFPIMFTSVFLLYVTFIFTYLNPSIGLVDLSIFRWFSLTGLAVIYVITVLNIIRKVPEKRWH